MATLKVVVLGDATVGKSSLVQRYVYDIVDAKQTSTIGAAMIPKRVQTTNFHGTLNIWDTAGQERYKSLAPLYCRGASIGIIIYDIMNRNSYDNAKHALLNFREMEPNAVVGFVGNKLDLTIFNDTVRSVEQDEASEFAEANNAIHFEISTIWEYEPIETMMQQLISKCDIPVHSTAIESIRLDELIDNKRDVKRRCC